MRRIQIIVRKKGYSRLIVGLLSSRASRLAFLWSRFYLNGWLWTILMADYVSLTLRLWISRSRFFQRRSSNLLATARFTFIFKLLFCFTNYQYLFNTIKTTITVHIQDTNYPRTMIDNNLIEEGDNLNNFVLRFLENEATEADFTNLQGLVTAFN